MHLESLKIFCDVVRHQSFSLGASANDVSQSAASQIVGQIEKRLGVRLIDRSHRPFTLTAEGEVYYRECRDLLDRYWRLEERVRGLGRRPSSDVRVAAIYSVGFADLSIQINRFRDQAPACDVRIDFCHPETVYQRVRHDDAELGMVSFPQPSRDLATIPWRDEPMIVACSPRDPWSSRNEVDPAELSGRPFLGFLPGMSIRREIDRYLQSVGADVVITGEFDNIDTIVRAVSEGVGLAILPKPSVERERDRGAIHLVELAGHGFVRPLHLIHRRGQTVGASAQLLIQILCEHAERRGQRPAPLEAESARGAPLQRIG